MLFFKIICFVWAAIGIVSRIAMAVMKEKWAVWEENQAYKEKRPGWVAVVAVVGLLLIAAIWAVYIIFGVPYGWVLGVLITLTSVKVVKLLFSYNEFRVFLKNTLADKTKMMRLNIAVIILSVGLVCLGIFLY